MGDDDWPPHPVYGSYRPDDPRHKTAEPAKHPTLDDLREENEPGVLERERLEREAPAMAMRIAELEAQLSATMVKDDEIKIISQVIINSAKRGLEYGLTAGRAEGLHEAARIVLTSSAPSKYRLRREVASALAEQIVAAIKSPSSADETV